MDSIYLEYKSKKGDLLTYGSMIENRQSVIEKGQTKTNISKIQFVMTQETTDVDSSGIATVDIVIKSGVVISGEQSVPLPNTGQKITMKMKKTGEIIYTSVPVDFSQPSFPEGLKKKKDIWTSVSKINIKGKPEPLELNYRYILWDISKYKGMDSAEIKVSCPETTAEIQEGVNQKISATGSTLFDYLKGRLIKSEVETNTTVEVPQSDLVVKTRVSVKLELIKNS